MTRVETRIALALLAALATSCSPGDPPASLGSTAQALDVPTVRFSELHYDNAGTDVGEAIEVSGPAGTDVTGWQVVLYNGNGGASYSTQTLSGAIPATCGDRGVVVLNYPSNGIQNGSPGRHGARRRRDGAVVEFLSYEGTFAATNGPARGPDVDRHRRPRGRHRAGRPVAAAQRRRHLERPGRPTRFGACNDNGGHAAAAGGRERHGVAGDRRRSSPARRRPSRRPRFDAREPADRRRHLHLDEQRDRDRDRERDRRRDRRRGRRRDDHRDGAERGRRQRRAPRRRGAAAAAASPTRASASSTTTTPAPTPARRSRSRGPPAPTSPAGASCSTTATAAPRTTREPLSRRRSRRPATRAASSSSTIRRTASRTAAPTAWRWSTRPATSSSSSRTRAPSPRPAARPPACSRPTSSPRSERRRRSASRSSATRSTAGEPATADVRRLQRRRHRRRRRATRISFSGPHAQRSARCRSASRTRSSPPCATRTTRSCTTTITWSSDTPDAREHRPGRRHHRARPRARRCFRATAADGVTTATYSLPDARRGREHDGALRRQHRVRRAHRRRPERRLHRAPRRVHRVVQPEPRRRRTG